MTDPTKTVTNPYIAKLIQYEDKLDAGDRAKLQALRDQGLAPKGGSSLTESQGKATGFYGRALEADQNFMSTKAATEPRGLIAQTVADIAPGVANTMTSSDRQLAEQAKHNFILASLRYESGASINADEFAKQEKVFFPQPGDSPEVIAQKAKDRQVVIQGLKEGSGPGATAMAASPDAPKPVNGDIGFATGDLPKGFTPEQATAYDAYLKANPKATPDQLKTFVHSLGFDLDNADAVAQGLDRGAGFVSGKDAVANAAKPIDPGDGTTGAVARGAGDALTLGILPRATAVVQSLKNDTPYSQELARQQGMRAFDEEEHFWPRFGGQAVGGLAGGFLFPGSEVRTAGSLAKTGGTMGAIYGVNSSNDLTDIPNVIKNGVVGGATGAAAGYGLGRLSDLFQGRGAPPAPPGGPPPTGNAVVDAAVRQDIPVVAADAFPGARGVTSFLESMPGSRGPINRRVQASADAMSDRVAELGNGVVAADRAGVGETVQTGAQNWVRRSGEVGGRLYTRAYDLAGGAQATPSNAMSTLNRHLLDLERTPGANGQKLNILNTIRGDLQDAEGNLRPLDIDSLRAIRTSIREQVESSNIRSSDLDRRLDDVMAAANRDIEESLAGNPRALAAFHRADAFWRDRADRVDNALSKVIGKADDTISGEQVMAKIESMAAPKSGNADRLGVVLGSLRPDEREQVAAHIANTLGRASPEEDFSPSRFLTQSRKLSDRARVQIFGRNGAEAINDLATIAEARVATVKDFNNSGSGRVRNYLSAIKGLLTGASGGAGLGAIAGGAAGAAAGGGVGVAAAGAGLVAGNISARVLTNPAVARALARGLRATTVDGARASITRLGDIATSNPSIRAEVLGIQQKLAQAVNDNMPAVTSAAASNGERPRDQQ